MTCPVCSRMRRPLPKRARNWLENLERDLAERRARKRKAAQAAESEPRPTGSAP